MGSRIANIVGRPCGFDGGIFLPRPGERASSGPVQSLPSPPMLYVLMQQHDGPPSTVCVEPGQLVAAGQRIGKADLPGSLHVHSPVSGRVVGITTADSARRTDVPAVQIQPDPRWHGNPPPADCGAGILPAFPRRLEACTTNEGCTTNGETHESGTVFLELIAAADGAGLTDFQPRAGSLADLLREAARRGIGNVIVNTLAGEPIPFAAVMDSQHDPQTLVRVAQWIGQATKARRIMVAVDRAEAGTVAYMRAAVAGTPVRVVALANKYPQHVPVLLAASIAGVQTPPGGSTLDVGVLVLEWQAVLALAAAWDPRDVDRVTLDCGTGFQPATPLPHREGPGEGSVQRRLETGATVPMTYRDISVSGPAVARPGCYRISLGTPFEHILRHVGLTTTVRRVIEGGAITGQAVGHLGGVVTKQTSALLVLDRTGERVPTPGPCVHCGWCQEDCPVGLDPQAILDLAERGEFEAARSLHPQACVGCGLCSYVCPAELPLAHAVGRMKRLCDSQKGGT